MSRIFIVIAAILTAATIAEPAFAYVGPGAGLSLLGALWGLLLAVLAAFAFVASWPFRRWASRRRAAAASDASARRVERPDPGRPSRPR
jgi:membrane protein implicated in regulation of membrane protease activity